MNEITLIANNQAISVKFPPVLTMTNDKEYHFGNAGYSENVERSTKNKNTYQLFQDFQGKFVVYTETKSQGVSVWPSRELKQIVFPVTMFKDAAFVKFIKDNHLDKSMRTYIAHHDEANTLKCVVVKNGLHLYSDGDLLFTEFVNIGKPYSGAIHAINYGNRITFVSNVNTSEENRFETLTLSKAQLGLDDDAVYFPSVTNQRKELIQNFFAEFGIKLEERAEKTIPVVECSMSCEKNNLIPTTLDVLNSRREPMKVEIYGDIIAENIFPVEDLPFKTTASGEPQISPIKVIVYKETGKIGLGFVIFNLGRDGKLQYIDKSTMTEFKSASDYTVDLNGTYVILQSVYDILKSQGVESPENYVGLLSGDVDSHPHSEKAFALGDDRVIYGEFKFSFAYGRKKTIRIFEQFDRPVAYLFVEGEEPSISKVGMYQMPNILNKMSVKGDKDAYYAGQIIEYLVKRGELQ